MVHGQELVSLDERNRQRIILLVTPLWDTTKISGGVECIGRDSFAERRLSIITYW